ncbi:DNA polymerase III subunit delta [Marinoscillum sp. MHG1-6]|uniref:DNA polymerase III subunit n=1 Tax=Marinoscillum sp. MHG1-6 TaxID=2959627 RepID=UPI0021587576|nr:DNA polymerase III subunit delta [Marinoscillum sp. MHG1-6]
MQFAEIPGLKDIKHSLISSYENNHIAHAQLFNGVEGGGALPMALAFTTFLLCENKQPEDSCGTCANCQKMKKFIHPDVHFFFPKLTFSKQTDIDKHHAETQKNWRTFATNNPFGGLGSWVALNGFDNKNMIITKEESRRIIKTVSMKSFEGDFKIVIIWCPEYMHPNAANGILKILEEPPTQTIYLLVSYAYERLLATIKSRVQLFSIPPLNDEEVANYLIEKHQAEAEKARQVSRMATGSIGKALKELESAGELAYQDFQDWMRQCLRRDFTALATRSEDFAKSSKPDQRNTLEFALTLIRESIVAQAGDEGLVHREGAEKDFIMKFGSAVSFEALEYTYFEISAALGNLSRNSNARITFMNLSLTISQLLSKKAA